MHYPDFKNELNCFKEGYEYVIGCDEVGMGPLAGPVVAAACVLDKNSIGERRSKNKWYARVRDSKTISEAEREVLAVEIFRNSLAWGVGEVWPQEIDELNIHKAGLLAMERAVENLGGKLGNKKTFVFVDGRFQIPAVKSAQKSVIKGDGKLLSIAAASIIAKVHRDKIMKDFGQKFPEYGFAKHKGYGTALHIDAIKKLGVLEIHRKSFLSKI